MDHLDNIIEGKLFIAGACSIESKEHILRIAKKVKESGANILRGGAYKPRTSPYTFQGMGTEAIDYLVEAKNTFNMPIVSEVLDPRHIKYFEDVDILQVGARNMQNFELLKELGATDKYILLKRAMGATIDELLSASEYIRAGGNDRIILCERGIRTFETSTRFTLDISSIAVLKDRTDLKIIIDPSHATGIAKYVSSVALAGIAAGSDGFIIEVHDNPTEALTDRLQQIVPDVLKDIIEKSKKIIEIIE